MKKQMGRLLILSIFFQGIAIFTQFVSAQDPQIHLSQTEVSNGSTIMAYIHLPKAGIEQPQLECNGDALPLFRLVLNSKKFLMGFIPIGYQNPLGPTMLTLRWRSNHRKRVKRLPLTVSDGLYPTDELKVEASKVVLSEKDLARVRRERKDLNAVYDNPHQVRYWRSEFVQPINSIVTSPYGTQRLFNNQLKSVHSGVDLRAPMGTPIRSMNHGVVRLMKNLFYAGNAVIIDHGLGLYSSYAHMSKFSVKLGQKVRKGEVIGFSGSTGRVNAPHLHWQVKISNVGVNPIQFMQSVNAFIQKKVT